MTDRFNNCDEGGTESQLEIGIVPNSNEKENTDFKSISDCINLTVDHFVLHVRT